MKNFFAKISRLRYWEFWPLWLTAIPLTFIGLFFSIRSRRLFYVTNVNPAFENSAMAFASKMNILNHLNQDCIPKSILISNNDIESNTLEQVLKSKNIEFPVVAKPDKGERGRLVEKINNIEQLKKYLASNDIDFIIQEYIALPNEIGIFFYKIPNESRINISSVCLKKFLSIKGDGRQTIAQLLENHFHGKYQLSRLESIFAKKLDHVLEAGEELLLEPIGNHSRGTEFYDGSYLMDAKLIKLVEYILNDAEGIHYGRFDIKYNSIEELKNLENFSVIELNGVASEPTHVYDRSINVFKKYKVFFDHFKIMYRISKLQRQNGYQPMSISSGFKVLKQHIDYLSSLNRSWKTA